VIIQHNIISSQLFVSLNMLTPSSLTSHAGITCNRSTLLFLFLFHFTFIFRWRKCLHKSS